MNVCDRQAEEDFLCPVFAIRLLNPKNCWKIAFFRSTTLIQYKVKLSTHFKKNFYLTFTIALALAVFLTIFSCEMLVNGSIGNFTSSFKTKY